MPLFIRSDILSEDVAEKVHNFDADSFRWVLSNTAPVLGSTFVLANIVQIATGGGYTAMSDGAGGLLVDLATSRPGGSQTTTISQLAPVQLVATGPVATFRWLVLVNDTAPLNPVVGWIEHADGAVTMQATVHLHDAGRRLVHDQLRGRPRHGGAPLNARGAWSRNTGTPRWQGRPPGS